MANDDSEESLLAQLSDRAYRVNTATDGLNQKIEAVEAQLLEMNIGLNAWVSVDSAGFTLGYAKIDKEWRLCAKDTFGGEIVPVANLSRFGRAKAIMAIPTLLRTLLKEAEVFIKYLEDSNGE